MRQLIFVLILLNFLIYSIVVDWLSDKKLVAFLDIGQGNAVLIRNRNNVILYDTGKYPSLLFKELDKLLPFYQRKIDILIISHQDKDHYWASFELLKRLKVRLIVLNGLFSSDSSYQKFISLIKNKNIPIIFLDRGDKINDNHFHLLVLNPDKNKKFRKDNDNSIVVRLQGKKSYLFTGDIEKSAIADLIKCCRQHLKADFFLVPHHGSRYSIDENFYFLVKPEIAVIQVGSNFYGHPHLEVLNILSKYVLRIWRTDIDKSLVINDY